MFKNILSSVSGIEIYAITGLVIFIVMFSAVLIWLFKVDKTYIKKMEQLPLDNKNKDNLNFTGELNDR